MSDSRNKSQKNKNKLEKKMSDSLANLEQFTETLAENIDFDSFDVLSITRVDTEQPYTRRFSHPKAQRRAWRLATETLRDLPRIFRRYKLN
jgi:single-stranded DNA-specific DHH superfamily exonuclease